MVEAVYHLGSAKTLKAQGEVFPLQNGPTKGR